MSGYMDIGPVRSERRPNRRQRVLLSGLVTFARGTQCFSCSIRNLTAHGARVSIRKRHGVPSQFYLINLHGQVAYDCKLVWNNGVEAGVAFRKSIPLGDLQDPRLTYLKRLGETHATGSIVRAE
jgi:hypothetical protein